MTKELSRNILKNFLNGGSIKHDESCFKIACEVAIEIIDEAIIRENKLNNKTIKTYTTYRKR